MGMSLVHQFGVALRKLMKENPEASSAQALEKLTRTRAVKIGKSTIDRASKGQVAIGLDVLESLAKTFGLRPWQLLRLAEPESNEKEGHKNNPLWVGHSAAHRELYATVLAAGPTLPESACRTLTDLVRQLSPSPVVPDADAMSIPVINETISPRELKSITAEAEKHFDSVNDVARSAKRRRELIDTLIGQAIEHGVRTASDMRSYVRESADEQPDGRSSSTEKTRPASAAARR